MKKAASEATRRFAAGWDEDRQKHPQADFSFCKRDFNLYIAHSALRCAQLEIKETLPLISLPSIDSVFPRSSGVISLEMDQSQLRSTHTCVDCYIWFKTFCCYVCIHPQEKGRSMTYSVLFFLRQKLTFLISNNCHEGEKQR